MSPSTEDGPAISAPAIIDCVVIGQQCSVLEAPDEESRLTTHLLLRDLPPAVLRMSAPARDLTVLVRTAVDNLMRLGLPDAARVLLLAHDQMAPAPQSYALLAAALERGASAACAFGSNNPPAHMPPDYATARGMERYARRLASLDGLPCAPENDQPLAVLTTCGALRAGTWARQAVWAPGAYLHDVSAYRSGMRAEVIPLVPMTARRILDVGGGEGGFLAALKSQRQCETHLAEFSAPACRIAAARVDKVWQGDFLSLPITGTFDCISFLDVLEHTQHPSAWLARAAELLDHAGVIVASIPNVGHWSVVADLIEGRWDYAPAGIHCITHLRFFTRHGVEALLSDAGFEPVRVQSMRVDPPAWFDVSALRGQLTIDSDSLATQTLLIVARKKP